MSKEIQSPKYFASQYEGSQGYMLTLASRILERDEQIAAWCIEAAQKADQEAEAHERKVTGEHGRIVSDTSHHERACRCEGQASSLRALAALLMGLS